MIERKSTQFTGIGGMIMAALFFVALFYLAKGFFSILYWVAPILLIITLFLDHKTVLNFVKYVFNSYKSNLPVALVLTALTFFFPPVVIGFLFGKVLLKRKINKVIGDHKEKKEQYAEYEVVEEEEEEDFLELPQLEVVKEKASTQKTEKPKNSYDDLFD